MERLRSILGPLGLLALLVLASGPAVGTDDGDVAERQTGGSYTWYEDAAGFERALDEAFETKAPLAVYFYTDWCGYCRQLEREVLYRAETEDYMRHVTKVRINPENGHPEGAIARHYGVFSFPSFFVHAGPGNEAKKLTGRIKRDGEWQMQTPDEFVESLRELVENAK